MVQRRVIRGGSRSFKTRALQFLASFTSPSRFKRYWLNAQGARRFGIIAGAFVLFIFAVFVYFARDLPSPSKINAKIGNQNTIFYDSKGQNIIYEVHGSENRRVIPFNQMPADVKNATIAIEDKNFYHEGAFSFTGYLRAAFVDFVSRGAQQGGSTITQQYVKNALLDPNEHTITRKIKELILSLEIESLYNKDDILKLYLNEIPYGSESYGIESACRTYFSGDIKNDQCAQNLTLQQASMLAAIANAPSYYSPYGPNVSDLAARQNLVLQRMVDQKLISLGDANAAKLTTDTLASATGLNASPAVQTAVSPYPHFAQYAESFLENQLGTNEVENGGLKVITTLDEDKQKIMQDAIAHNIKEIRALGGSNAAMVAADPKNGHVLAMMGSYNADDPQFGQFNVALANRQPGSSFKPIVYSTLMQNSTSWGPGSTIYDVKTDFGGGYTPKNYSGINYGVQSMRTALDGSLNIPAVKMLYIAGVQNSINMAHALGISTLNNPASTYGLSLVLGSGEVKLNDMVNAYESFANGGVHYQATPILKVTDPHNKVVIDNSKPKSKQILNPQVAYLISNILSDNNARAFIFGTNSPLHIAGRTVAAKTGTTENYNDAWTMGFSPDLVTGVWVGNNNNARMSNEAVDIAAPVWHDFMAGFSNPTSPNAKLDRAGALASFPTTDTFTEPSGIKTVTLDANTGRGVTASTRRTRTDLFPSWYKTPTTGSTTAQIDKVSGKLATSCTPPAAVETQTYGSGISAEIPSSDGEYALWEPPVAALAHSLGYSTGGGEAPTAEDDVHHCTDTKPSVQVTSAGSGPTIQITATVTSGTFPANQLQVSYDNQVISTQTINGSTAYTFTYTPTSTGSHTISATVTDTGLYSGQGDTTVTVVTAGGSSTPGGGAAGSTGIIPTEPVTAPGRRSGTPSSR